MTTKESKRLEEKWEKVIAQIEKELPDALIRNKKIDPILFSENRRYLKINYPDIVIEDVSIDYKVLNIEGKETPFIVNLWIGGHLLCIPVSNMDGWRVNELNHYLRGEI